MPIKKFSSAQLSKFAANGQRNREDSFEIGFAKHAAELKLSEAQYKAVYAKGLEELAKK